VAHCQPSPNISCKSVPKVLCKVANRQTDKQRRLHIVLGGGNKRRRQSSPMCQHTHTHTHTHWWTCFNSLCWSRFQVKLQAGEVEVECEVDTVPRSLDEQDVDTHSNTAQRDDVMQPQTNHRSCVCYTHGTLDTQSQTPVQLPLFPGQPG